MTLAPTLRCYLDAPDQFTTEATVLAVQDGWIAMDRSGFFPGGGGQPCDTGSLVWPSGERVPVTAVRSGEDDVLWHAVAAPMGPEFTGHRVRLVVDAERRQAHARHHTALHVLNTIALRDHGAWITGAQIGHEHSRIDFKMEMLSLERCMELAAKVNAVVREDRTVSARWLAESEFRRRDDLLRTLEVRPPVSEGRVRIVEIEGFDAQACGGTHVPSTGMIGRFSIFKTENKGKINKRMYVRLDALEADNTDPSPAAQK